ncbi:MAG: hypothetical protein HON77_21260, partial [Gammaproteobacteria bacterium]|nr:hypothetical protein [Gammaproteobacteria bacterium]
MPRLFLGRQTSNYRVSRTLFVLTLTLLSECVWSSPVDFKAQSVRIAMLQEPPSLDSSKATDLVSFFVLGHTTEGLLRYDRRGRLVAGVAESWDVTPTTLTFRLRPDARWHDGSKVTAADFVYAW